MGKEHDIKTLFDRYRRGLATEEEKHLISEWLRQLDVQENPIADERVQELAARSKAQLRQNLIPALPHAKIRHLRSWMPWAAACMIAGLFTLLLTVYPGRKPAKQAQERYAAGSENRSLLQLSDGRKIYLDTVKEGLIAIDQGTKISRRGNEIQYKGSAASGISNFVTTGKGKQFQIVLSDSTRIWLNGASKLSYPVQFAADLRVTQVSGEAYFEVKRAKKWPFMVKVANIPYAVRVLGTAFNVSTNKGKRVIQTTLVSGRVELDIKGATHKTVLIPSQKATYSLSNKQLQVAKVNTSKETDWIHQRLVFRQTPMSEALRRLEYFYHIRFEVKNTHIYQYTLTGTFDGKPLATVLEYMKLSSEIHYAVSPHPAESEERTLITLK